MAAPASKPQSRTHAWSCALINQCATPGLGSLLGRRFISGAGQLSLALAGFALLLGWMVHYFWRLALEQLEKPPPPHSYGWMAKWGVICFGAGWAWALLTSISLLRRAKADAPVVPERVPPRISG